MELKHYALFLWRWLWLISLCAALGAGLAYLYTRAQPQVYAASTMLMVNQDQGNFARPSPTLEDLRARERYSLTIRELLLMRTVLEEAASAVEGVSVSQLANRASTADVGETELFLLTVNDTDRARAAQLADAIVNTFKARERDLLDNPFAQASSLIVVEPARAGSAPISPDLTRNVALFTFLAIALAILIGFLYDYFNPRIEDEDDMDRRGGGRPLAVIRKLPGATPAALLVTLREPASSSAETYRMFRAHLDTFPAERKPQTLAVVSAGPQEGRSLTAANLAIAIAQTGRRVVLVDADLRSPSLHTFFDLPNQGGLSNLLSSDASAPLAFLRQTGVENLRLLTAGQPGAVPAQLLGAPQLEQLTAALRAEADLVIFDSAPLLPLVDTTLLARVSDVALVVVRAGHTSETALRRTATHLSQAGVATLGVLLNGVAPRQMRLPHRPLRSQPAGRPHPAEGTPIDAARVDLAGKAGD